MVLRCKNYQLANLYPARAVALGYLFMVMEDRGLRGSQEREKWVDSITGHEVDTEDFEEVIGILGPI